MKAESSHSTMDLERYLDAQELERLFKKLGALNLRKLAGEVQYFSSKEAEKRDTIVQDYLGKAGINRIVDTVAAHLLAEPALSSDAKILDAGAGTGFFTAKIAQKVSAKLPDASFYAMDITPAMLLVLQKKHKKITPFLGLAENIESSLKLADKFRVPKRFDAVFSTLMLHHSLEPEKVFQSLKNVLKKSGRAVVVDMCEHPFEEFKTEMGDVHLGFKPEHVRKMAKNHFTKVEVEKISKIVCECSGRAAEIFVATMLI